MAKTKEPKEAKEKAPKEKKAKTVGIEKPKKAKAPKEAATGDDSDKKSRGPLTPAQKERRNRHKRSRGLRGKAIEAGFLKRTAGTDILASLLTKGEIKKMLKFVPVRVGREQDGVKGGFDKSEHEERNAARSRKLKVESRVAGYQAKWANSSTHSGRAFDSLPLVSDTTELDNVLRKNRTAFLSGLASAGRF